jgi:hypothetical protein
VLLLLLEIKQSMGKQIVVSFKQGAGGEAGHLEAGHLETSALQA